MHKAPTIEHFMTRLPRTIGRDATLEQAHQLMREFGVRHLPVVSDDKLGTLIGIVSQRDLHLIESLKDVDEASVPVEDAMSESVYTTSPDEPIDKVAAHMASQRIGSAVVMDGQRIAGIFTTTDALVALLSVWKT